mgnify:CR=1 FL=1
MVEPILEIKDLNISFFTRAGEIPAVMDFSCTVMPGETMGLVENLVAVSLPFPWESWGIWARTVVL